MEVFASRLDYIPPSRLRDDDVGVILYGYLFVHPWQVLVNKDEASEGWDVTRYVKRQKHGLRLQRLVGGSKRSPVPRSIPLGHGERIFHAGEHLPKYHLHSPGEHSPQRPS